MQPVEDPELLPVPKPSPARHPGTKPQLLRQVLPPDPGEQHEQDPLQHLPIRQRLRPRPTRRTHRQQRPYPGPQLVRHDPRRSHTKIISNQDHQPVRGLIPMPGFLSPCAPRYPHEVRGDSLVCHPRGRRRGHRSGTPRTAGCIVGPPRTWCRALQPGRARRRRRARRGLLSARAAANAAIPM